MTAKGRGLLLVGTSAVIYGLEPILAKFCYQYGFSVILVLTARFVLATIFLLLFAVITKQPLILPREKLKTGLILGLLTAGATGALFKAFELLPAAIAIFCFYIYPSLTSVLARFLNNVPITKVRVVAIAVCFLGLFLMYWGSFELKFNIIGVLFAVLAALFMSVLILLLEKHMPTVNKISYTLTVYYLSTFIFLLWTLINKDLFTIGDIQPIGWLYALLLVLLPTLASNLLLSFGMSSAPAVDASILNTLEIPSAVVFAFLIFGDILVGWQIVGALLIIAAAVTPSVAAKLQERAARKRSGGEPG